MSRDARKKQKHRLKRRQKQIQARKTASVTPLDRIARSGGALECYVNANWREMGMASLQVLGRAPDGRCAYAAFLVDVWCVGLKDAFGRREMSRPDFEDVLDVMDQQTEVVDVSPAEAKRLVAGGIRFARQNGFRLPPHFDRWTSIFGDPGDVATADLSGFGVEGGGLRYVGSRAFLQRRLIGCTVDEFLTRPDVQWVMGDGTPREASEGDYADDFDYDQDGAEDDEDAAFESDLLEGLKEVVGTTGARVEDAVRKWCFQTGQPPHPRLHEAVGTLLVSTLPMAMYQGAVEEEAREGPRGDGAPPLPDPSELPDPLDLIEVALDGLPPDERQSVADAMDQVQAFMSQFKDPLHVLNSVDGADGAGGALPPPQA